MMYCRYITFIVLTIAVHGVIALNIDMHIQRAIMRKSVPFTAATLEWVPSGPKTPADEAYARERHEHRKASLRQIEIDVADSMFLGTCFVSFPTAYVLSGVYDPEGPSWLREQPKSGGIDKGTEGLRQAKQRYMKIGVNSLVSGLLISCFLVPMLVRADRLSNLDRQDSPGNT